MRVIPPIEITDAMLTASDITELDGAVDPAEWSAVTAYVIGDTVSLAAEHRIYECIQAGTNKNPLTETAYWTETGATNKWAMFDYTRNQASVYSGGTTLTFEITPGERANAIAFNGVAADSIRVDVLRGAVLVYSTDEIPLYHRTVTGWYSWFFRAFAYRDRQAVFTIPPFSDAVIQVTLTRGSGAISLSACAIGMYQDIGVVTEGAGDDSISYSSVTRGIGGETSMVRRRSINTNAMTLMVENPGEIDAIRDLRAYLDARVAFWVGVDDEDHALYQSFFRQGFYTRFRITDHPNHSTIDLEVEDI